MNKSRLEVLVSTMNRTDGEFLEGMNLESDALVVNQSVENKIIAEKIPGVRVINQGEMGLSRSRNALLENAAGDICLIADDDLEYNPGYHDVVLKAHEESAADIIAFQVRRTGSRKTKVFSKRAAKLNLLTIMKVSSVEISFKRAALAEKNIRFDVSFGSGSGKYISGEDNVFLAECLSRGLEVVYLPIEIASVNVDESSWFKGFNQDFFKTKGAMFTAISSRWSLFFIMQFLIRKRRLYHENIRMTDALKAMLDGRREYLDKGKTG